VPERGGGIVEIGLLGLPWLPVGFIVLLFAAVWALNRLRTGASLRPRLRLERDRRPRSAERIFWTFVGLLTMNAAIVFGLWAIEGWRPLTTGTFHAPGIGITEVVENQPDGDPMSPEPDYIYKVLPGEDFSYRVSVRNDSLVRIGIVGRSKDAWPEGPDPGNGVSHFLIGLGVPRDPTAPTAPDQVIGFEPIDLKPGQEATLVIGWRGGACADPTGPLDTEATADAIWMPLVYEFIGWRREATVWLPFDVTVPSRPGCESGG
jgi:hypothetical protein